MPICLTKPTLTIRGAVLIAVIAGLLVPPVAMLWWDDAALVHMRSWTRLVLAQLLLTGAIVLAVLYARITTPVERLKRQASAMAWRDNAPPVEWRRRDELGQLGRHLNEVRERLETLFGRLEQQKQQLESLAMYDQLTQLPNRGLFTELCRSALQSAQRDGTRLALLFIDLDRFKTINDSMGHSVGDQLLQAMARRLRDVLRESDVVCRLGGDEFLVLLRDAGKWDEIAATIERILVAVEQPMPLASHPIQVSASVGVALYPDDAQDYETLARHADIAMYQAKGLGRARFSFYHADLNNRLQANVALAQELARAIRGNELLLYYQPQIEAKSGRLTGVEALIRWQHPERGLLAPAAFIGVAEECGLIGDLGAWTVNEACRQIALWRGAGRVFGHVAVNISALEFRQHRLIDVFSQAMSRHGVDPSELEIEITESVLMSDTETTHSIISRLRALGLRLVIDDFGTGYSSLAYLKHLRPAKLKIDRAFVRDIDRDADDRALTSAIIGLARALDIPVVAEGVETDTQMRYIVEDGGNLVQGYLLGAPMTAEALEVAFLLAGVEPGPRIKLVETSA
ncbi:putative bifunctional diguanylate cyclase/phosphodiesterase [Aquabacterium sp.]|uniref:putative bifunctional diguanylate cyclase/phosphodiesterase n=1 Tax=Aquabacterium sp. TaxID=1872578 RepID=UPI0035B0C2B9